jgi:hypothetical protein
MKPQAQLSLARSRGVRAGRHKEASRTRSTQIARLKTVGSSREAAYNLLSVGLLPNQMVSRHCTQQHELYNVQD